MFLCTLCGKKSNRGEIPFSILHEARRLNPHSFTVVPGVNQVIPKNKGWEIVREGPAAGSHRHKPKWSEEFKRWTPWVGFKVS